MKINKWKARKQHLYHAKGGSTSKVFWFIDGKESTVDKMGDDFLAKHPRVIEYGTEVAYLDLNMAVLECGLKGEKGVSQYWSIEKPALEEDQWNILQKHKVALVGQETPAKTFKKDKVITDLPAEQKKMGTNLYKLHEFCKRSNCTYEKICWMESFEESREHLQHRRG